MKSIHQYPPHIRKKIIVSITGCVGILLLFIFVYIYTHQKAPGTAEPVSRLQTFYNTILTTGQSYLEKK